MTHPKSKETPTIKLATREMILAAKDIRSEDVEVPEWDTTVRVRGMTGAERDSFESGLASGNGKAINLDNVRARIVSLCAVDESGKRLFTADDVAELGQTDAAALDRVFAVARRLSGLGA